jgi:pimeloyl-ACP methyl ester carboxylesterase
VSSISLNHKIIGQGPPVIFLHGLFGTSDNWLNFARKLEAHGYMSILVDQRDHGRSPHTSAFSYPILANDLYDFMNENWIYSSIIIGHSMGGKTGLQFASQYPHMISKFICIDIGIKKYEQGHNAVFDALFSVDIDKVESRDEVYHTLISRLKDEGTVQFLMKNLSRRKEGGFEWKLNLQLLFNEYPNILASISIEDKNDTDVMFIRGSKSNYILDEDIPNIQQKFPRAQIKTIQGAGHWIHVDKPIELFDQIMDFIKN